MLTENQSLYLKSRQHVLNRSLGKLELSRTEIVFLICVGLILKRVSGVSFWREEKPSVWEKVKGRDTQI